MPARGAAEDQANPPNIRALRLTLITVTLIAAVMGSLGAPLIPTIARSTGVSLSVADWLLTAALLTGALATPIMGRLSDGPHQRRIVISVLCLVLTGLVLAGLSNVFAVLVTARSLQGLALGLMPVTMSIARRHMPAREASRTIGALSITGITGAGLGYPASGLLAEVWNFHTAFWAAAIMVVFVLIASLTVLPQSSGQASRPFDLIGALLISGALTSLIVMLSEAARWGWTSAETLGLFVTMILLTILWTRYELRQEDPLVDLRQVRNRLVMTANLSGFLVSVCLYLYLPTIVTFIQMPTSTGYGLGASVLAGSCVLAPLSAGTVVASQLAPWCERRIGRRGMIPLGSLVVAVSMIGFVVVHGEIWDAFISSGVVGVGMGFTYAAMPGFITNTVRPGETGSAMSFYQVLRNVGLATGSALTAVMLATFTESGSGSLPRIAAFEVSLLVAAAVCVTTAILSYILAGPDNNVEHLPDVIVRASGELGGAGIMADDHVIALSDLPAR